MGVTLVLKLPRYDLASLRFRSVSLVLIEKTVLLSLAEVIVLVAASFQRRLSVGPGFCTA